MSSSVDRRPVDFKRVFRRMILRLRAMSRWSTEMRAEADRTGAVAYVPCYYVE